MEVYRELQQTPQSANTGNERSSMMMNPRRFYKPSRVVNRPHGTVTDEVNSRQLQFYSANIIPYQPQQHPQHSPPRASESFQKEVFVGNLSFFCERHHLFELFDAYANVTQVRIICNNANNRSLMFGFVTLATMYEAKEMSKLLTGHLFMGRKLRVDVCTKHHEATHPNPTDDGYQVHVNFSSAFMLCDDKPQQFVRPTEGLLRKTFIRFGSVIDASVKQYNVEPMLQEGYGFITFESLADAMCVPTKFVLHGIHFVCSLAHKLTNHNLLKSEIVVQQTTPPPQLVAHHNSFGIYEQSDHDFATTVGFGEREQHYIQPYDSSSAIAAYYPSHFPYLDLNPSVASTYSSAVSSSTSNGISSSSSITTPSTLSMDQYSCDRLRCNHA